MDKTAFKQLLASRNLTEEQIEASVAIALRFENRAAAQNRLPSAQDAQEFAEELISNGEHSFDNFLALARYGLFTRNNPVFGYFLELIDGAEAQPNLYRFVGETFGEKLRDEVFSGVGIAPIGLSPSKKPATMHPVLERLQARVGDQACMDILSGSLRDLPDVYYQADRKRFQESGSLEEYLALKKAAFVQELETCQKENRPFFAQVITDQVLEFVRADPEIGGGVRQGNLIYETKIPFLTDEYLCETDPTLKRYYYCHCPWAREAIKDGSTRLLPLFCNCSAGYHKRSWEVIFGQKLQADVLETVLQGDLRCRFAIHLPLEATG